MRIEQPYSHAIEKSYKATRQNTTAHSGDRLWQGRV